MTRLASKLFMMLGETNVEQRRAELASNNSFNVPHYCNARLQLLSEYGQRVEPIGCTVCSQGFH